MGGISRNPVFEETRKAMYEGAKRAVAAISQCTPHSLQLPIKARKQRLVFDAQNPKGKLMTKEGEIPDMLHILDF